MRRNARFYNLRRFLSVGLAVVMIASTEPIMAYAEDGDSGDQITVTEADNARTASEHTASDNPENDTATKAVEDASATLTDSTEKFNLSEEEKNEVATIVKSLDNVAGVLAENTIDENGKVVENSVQTNLDNAATSMYEGVKKQAEGDKYVDPLQKSLDAYDKDEVTTAIGQKSTEIEKSTGDVRDNVLTANNSNSKDEAYKAKDSAQSAYDAANKSLGEANTAYDNAKTAVEEISKSCKEAQDLYDEAKGIINDANDSLVAAKGQMEVAVDNLNQAEANLQKLLGEDSKELNAIYNQYHGFMVIYYKTALGKVKVSVPYDENNNLNFDECAVLVDNNSVNGNNLLNTMAVNPGNNVFDAGRDLFVKEVTYMLENEGATDIKFVCSDATDAKDATAKMNEFYNQNKTTLEKNYGYNLKKDFATKTAKEVERQKDKNGNVTKENYVFNGNNTYLAQAKGGSSDSANMQNGRANSFFVTYTDKDGNATFKGYNYIIKDTIDVNDVDEETGKPSIKEELKTGAIFIAEIGTDHNPVAVSSEYLYDDYAKLEAQVKALNSAFYAVDAAKTQVSKLKDEIDGLSVCVLNTDAYTKYTKLKDQLEEAQKALENAEKTKANLEDKVVEAKKALDSINLSRFNTSSSSSSSSSNPSTGTPATTPVVTTVAQAPVQPANELIVTGPIVTLFDDAVPLTDIPVRNVVKKTADTTTKTTTDAKDNTNKKTPKKATVELEEDEVPLAAAPAENIEEKTENKSVVNNVLPDANDADTAIAWWWWLIVVIVAAIITKVSYEINKKSKENKSNK